MTEVIAWVGGFVEKSINEESNDDNVKQYKNLLSCSSLKFGFNISTDSPV